MPSLSAAAAVAGQQQLLESVADDCIGYVAADLAALVARAHWLQNKALTAKSVNNSIDDEEHGAEHITRGWKDNDENLLPYLRVAKKDVGASALREIIPPSSTMAWDDIIGNDQVKKLLVQAIEWHIMKQEAFRRLDLQPPRGNFALRTTRVCKDQFGQGGGSRSGILFSFSKPMFIRHRIWVTRKR
jgi:SpoVK/Ycf46/Vps4 family AAA+-type ATPase